MVVWDIQALFGNVVSPSIYQMKSYWLSLIAQAGAVCLLCLYLLIRNMIPLAFFYKYAAGFDEIEGDIVSLALFTELLDPFVVTRPGTIVVFASTKHLFNLTSSQIMFYVNRSNQWSSHDSFVLKWQVKENWDPFIRTALVLTGDIEENIVPSFAPVFGKMVGYSLRPFGQQKKLHITALPHDVPCVRPPFISFFQKKSEVMQTRIISPLWILYWPCQFFWSG